MSLVASALALPFSVKLAAVRRVDTAVELTAEE